MIRAVCSFLAITLSLSNELRVSSGLEIGLVDGSNVSQFSNDRQLDIAKFNKLNARRSDINVGKVSNLQQDGEKAVEIIEDIAEVIIENKDEIKAFIKREIDKKNGNDGKNPDKKPSKGGDNNKPSPDKKPSKGGDKNKPSPDKKPSKGGDDKKPPKGGDKNKPSPDKKPSKGGDDKKPPKGGDNKKEPKGGPEKKKEPSKGPKSPKGNVKGPYIRSKA